MLIIDNRTSYFDIDHLQQIIPLLEEARFANEFSEVWFYTGFYSDNDGNRAEYSFCPLKLPHEIGAKFDKWVQKSSPDPSEKIVYD